MSTKQPEKNATQSNLTIFRNFFMRYMKLLQQEINSGLCSTYSECHLLRFQQFLFYRIFKNLFCIAQHLLQCNPLPYRDFWKESQTGIKFISLCQTCSLLKRHAKSPGGLKGLNLFYSPDGITGQLCSLHLPRILNCKV